MIEATEVHRASRAHTHELPRFAVPLWTILNVINTLLRNLLCHPCATLCHPYRKPL